MMALKTLVAGAALVAVAALGLGATDANAQTQPKKKYARTYYGPTQGYRNPNYSYMSGPRTRVFVTRRSWLDAGTEVLPGERKFTDYALAPGYSYGMNIDRLYTTRRPLGDTPLDFGGYPIGFPLY
ncbi:MAG: hypothetical protein HY242_13885 [Afipia sp.]|nr:hypothetical protein [Afipia sp.]